MGDGGLYDISLYINLEGQPEELIYNRNLPKETKVRELLQDFDPDNHPFRLLLREDLTTSVNIDDTLEELSNNDNAVREVEGSPNKLLSLVQEEVPPETNGSSDASSNSGGSLGSLYSDGGSGGGKSKRKSKRKQRRKSKRNKSKRKQRRKSKKKRRNKKFTQNRKKKEKNERGC